MRWFHVTNTIPYFSNSQYIVTLTFDRNINMAHHWLMGSLYVKFHDDSYKGKVVMRIFYLTAHLPCLQTEGRTDGWTGWFQYTPPPLTSLRRYKKCQWAKIDVTVSVRHPPRDSKNGWLRTLYLPYLDLFRGVHSRQWNSTQHKVTFRCHLKGFYYCACQYEDRGNHAFSHTALSQTDNRWNGPKTGMKQLWDEMSIHSGTCYNQNGVKKKSVWHFVPCLKFLSHAKGGAIFFIRSPLVKLADYTSKLERYRNVCVDLTDDT